jgi:outer membrane biosynthesis protein TonB
VARSYFWSLLIHFLLLLALLLGLMQSYSPEVVPEDVTVQVRRMELARPEKPRMEAGADSAFQPQPASISPAVTESDSAPAPAKDQLNPKAPPVAEQELVKNERSQAKPQFLISGPDYPTYQPGGDKESPMGEDALNLKGQTAARDRPAIPYYHPAVTLEGANGREWILVRFAVEANGTFDVEILEGTGNIHQDARALNVLRRWRWLPMQIDGETYPTVEVVRLYRRDIRPK